MTATGFDQHGGTRLGLLARAGELLSSPGAGEHTLERLAGLLVPSLASWCAIDVLREDGEIRRVAAVPATAAAPGHDAPHGPAVVMRTGEPELVRRNGGASLLCVPLMARARPWGAITLISAPDEVYGPTDVELAAELARRAATAIETARLVRSLEQSEERYRLLFEASPLPMWVYDAETRRFVAVNAAAVAHYGFTTTEFLRMTTDDLSSEPGTREHSKKDGTAIEVELTAGRVDFNGRAAALVLANDVTERRALEERLAQAEKMEAIGRLAGGVAHDFNNLITVISGYAEILLARTELDGREHLTEIRHAADQAAALTRQLLAFSRRQVLHPRVVDVNEIVAGMEPMVRRIIGRDVTVAVRLAAGPKTVKADRSQLERVILNLAANARDAMPTGGRLTIETGAVDFDDEFVAARGEGTAGPNVLLSVSDTGVGMSDDVQRQVFEPFFTTKEPGAGTGLGLATVFGVVKQSGGSIYVYSEPGRGTTFKVYLPATAPAPEEAEAPAPEPAAALGSETIMLVEDDASVRTLVQVMLESKGYRVLVANGPDEAERLCTSAVDLLLTDVIMPEVNGRSLAERLTTTAPAMRVLFMSGYSDDAVYRHGELSPDAAFIEKPFSDRALARKVREVLDA
ncbi:MAG TPA: ATP-binding protein [Solirubrobacteraceae bacterium]|nr:ATP-binding protein [Solirubrobacteraceae bacterium]